MKPLQRKKADDENLVLHEDSDILICHKPAGLAVQTKQLTQKDLESILKSRAASSSHTCLSVINRLDQPVEGLILFAKNKKAAADLSAQLTHNTLHKEYLAISSAVPECPEQTLTDYLVRDGRQNRSYVIDVSESCAFEKINAKQAKLHYKVLKVLDNHALLKIQLMTGRHHQIRVQMCHINAPLLGDSKYGGSENPQLCLCSHRLSFLHPSSRTPMDFTVFPKNPTFAAFLYE